MIKNPETSITFEDGRTAIAKLINEAKKKKLDWNEADTRFQFIDELLVKCLGWPKSEISVEKFQDGAFADYVLGQPTSVIWEAKKEGKYFELPANKTGKLVQSLPSIMSISEEANNAIKQVFKYCTNQGVEVAVVCNGLQLISFLAIRIGEPPLEGNALVFRDHNHMLSNFARMWQNLSPDGIAEHHLHRLLTSGARISLPPKPSTYLQRFPIIRYQSDTQATLKAVAELVIEDIPNNEDIEEKFYRECYCETGALSRDSLLSRKLLVARYASLFPQREDEPRVESASTQKNPLQITSEILTEAIARRPIVLLGDVGVGKTSFIKQLMLLRASEEFEQSINIYIDLGSTAALEIDLKKFVIGEIDRQLRSKYDVDTEDADFVRGVYDLNVKRFRNSVYGKAYRNDSKNYQIRVLKMLADRVDDKPTHLRECIGHISKARKRQVILILDNSDQRSTDIQQESFIIAQEVASSWNAMVFISVRPQTFFRSKRAGALSAYPHRVFTIAPPRPELVIEKRLKFALSVADGDVLPEKMHGITLNFEDLAIFLKAILRSMKNNAEIREILANITGGNIRSVIEFVVKVVGSPNVDVKKIIQISKDGGSYLIPIHEFSKTAILGDYSHYNPESSMAMNLFDVQYPDEREHFLSFLILEFLMWGESPKDKDGFTTVDDILLEIQRWKFLPRQIEVKLRRLTNRRLIESTERVTFEEDDALDLAGELPFAFRVTSVGIYHVRKWAGIFAYLDGMVFDTPVFDQKSFDDICKELEEFSIGARVQRAKYFRDYLTRVWNTSGLCPVYFDWRATVERGRKDFQRVENAVGKIKSAGGSQVK